MGQAASVDRRALKRIQELRTVLLGENPMLRRPRKDKRRDGRDNRKRPPLHSTRKKWQDHEVQYLRTNYGYIPNKEIAANLGRSPGAIGSKVRGLGIANRRRWRQWTEREEAYLRKYWAVRAVGDIAHSLGRTKNSVRRKATRMGILRQAEGCVSLSHLSQTLHISADTIRHVWVAKLGLAAQQVIAGDGKLWWSISPAAFWRWAEGHQECFSAVNLEPGALGEEPPWMASKRERDAGDGADRLPRQCRRWTPQEDACLIKMFRVGTKRKDMAQRLGRTIYAVDARCRKIGWDKMWSANLANIK